MSFQSLLDEFKLHRATPSTKSNRKQTSREHQQHKKDQAISNNNTNTTNSFSSISTNTNTINNDLKRKRNYNEVNKDRKDNKSIKYCDTSSTIKLPKDVKDLTIKITFLCIGAQKAGTSYLHTILNMHPNINVPKQKEVHFWDWYRYKGYKWYSQQYKNNTSKNKGNMLVNGEITPCYAALPLKDIKEISLVFPNIKIIFVVRDILDRTWSAILMELSNNVIGIEAGKFLSRKITKEEEDECNPNKYDDTYFIERMKHSTHLLRSDYSTCIKNWMKYIPSNQILLVNYKDLSNQPKYILQQILDFIGVGNKIFLESLTDDILYQRVNSGRGSNKIRPKLRKKMEDFLRPYAKEFNSLLESLGYNWTIDEYENSDS